MSKESKLGLPVYRCHKEVGAARIKSITVKQEPDNGDRILGLEVESGWFSVVVSGDFVFKHNPQVGGYFVEYSDGYVSFSPAEAFEEGYTKL